MPLLVLFIFGAVILGAGAMLSPAWPTQQPRVGLAAALALALIIGGAVFWAMAFGWDTLVVDYMLFALIIGIFLGGTLSFGQSRAEEKGEVLLDAEQGWPGPEDLLFLGAAALLLAIPPLFTPLPDHANAAQLAAAGTTALESRSFQIPVLDVAGATTGDVALYPPGFSALSAYLSQQLSQPIPLVQFAVGGVIALLCVWLMYDLGAEVRDKRLGRAMATALLFVPGFWALYLNAHYTALLGLAFALAFLIYAWRLWTSATRADAVGAGLLLGATIIAEPNAFPLALTGYLALAVATLVLRIAPTTPGTTRRALLASFVPALALLATGPWLLNGLLAEGEAAASLALMSGRGANPGEWLGFAGVGLVGLAILGVGTAWRRATTDAPAPRAFAGAMAVWTLIAFVAFDYGFILPLAACAGFGLLWVWEKLLIRRGRLVAAALALGLLTLGVTGVLLPWL